MTATQPPPSAASSVLAIDLGTSSVKVIILNQNGHVTARGTAAYETHRPAPGFAEQYPEDWWAATIDAVRNTVIAAGSARIEAVAVTGQMHGTVLLDNDARLLGPAIIWPDQRATPDLLELTARLGAGLAERIGGPLATGYQAATLAWMSRERPDIWERITRVFLPKDAIIYRLTDTAVTDPSDAVSTGLMDAGHGEWDADVLAALDIDTGWLPLVVPTGTPIVPLMEESARAFGLPAGIPVIVAGGDAPTAAIGAGVVDPAQGLLVLSTGAQVVLPTDAYEPDLDGRWHTWPSALPTRDGQPRWNRIGATLNAGSALTWLAHLIGSDLDVPTLVDVAATSPAGARGALFLPYLAGERSPVLAPHARGHLLGLTDRHELPDIARAVIEGVTFACRDAFEAMVGHAQRPDRLLIGGGGSASPVWQQIVADIFDIPVAPAPTSDLSVFGAALLGARALGWCELPRDLSRWTSPGPMQTPNPDHVAQYHELFGIYRDAFRATSALTMRLTRLTANMSEQTAQERGTAP